MIKSLLHFNNPDNLTKDEGKELAWQADGATADTDGKFGSAIDLTGQKRLIANKKWDIIQAGDFTVDFWVKVHSNTSDGRFISTRKSSAISDALEFYLYSSGNIFPQIAFMGSSDWVFGENTGMGFVALDKWYHIAVVRQDDNFYFFVDGRVVWNKSHSGSLYVSSNNSNITLGAYFSSSNVSLDEFRISDEALWTSDFTPPMHEASVLKYIFIDKNNTVMGMKE